MNTDEIIWALNEKYNSDAYAFIPQVRDSTGFAQTPRTADLIVMGLWPSRGIEMEGFEIKASRGDWLNELKNPHKADSISKYCDRWWIAVGDKEIVQPGELPPKWGLMVPRGKGMKVSVVAPILKPKLMSRIFLAAIMRRVENVRVPDSEAGKMKKELTEKITKTVGENFRYEIGKTKRRLEKLDEFEKALGSKIDGRWNIEAKEYGKLFKQVTEGRFNDLRERLVDLKEATDKISEGIVRELEEMKDKALHKQKEKEG